MEATRSNQRANNAPSPAVPSADALKLPDRVRCTIRARHYSRRTESASVDWIRRYIVFH